MNVVRAYCVAALATLGVVTGCGMAGGRAWIPQAPADYGGVTEERAAQARPSALATAAAAGPAVAPRSAAPTAAVPAASAASGYTQATRYGDLLFISGQIALDPRTDKMVGDKVEEQTRYVMEIIRQILESHRLNMANVVSVTVYLKDLTQFRAMDDVYETYFKSNLPARSVVEVSRLPRGALVEIAVVAGR